MCTDVARAVIAQCLEDDRRWSLQELQSHTGIDQTTVHLLNNKNGVAMKLVFIWEGVKMKKRTC